MRGQGRGRALRGAWLRSDADVVCYMDVDLSTDLRALLPLVAPLVSGHSDVAIGSRLAPGARVLRGRRREVVSRLYNRGRRRRPDVGRLRSLYETELGPRPGDPFAPTHSSPQFVRS